MKREGERGGGRERVQEAMDSYCFLLSFYPLGKETPKHNAKSIQNNCFSWWKHGEKSNHETR